MLRRVLLDREPRNEEYYKATRKKFSPPNFDKYLA